MLDNLKASVSQMLTNKKFLIVLFLSAVFIAIAHYMFITIISLLSWILVLYQIKSL